MKKRLLAIVVLISMISLSGCGFSESGELMSDARKFIEEGQYDKAMSNLSKVISEDESNTEARGMYYQALKLKKAVIHDSRKNYYLEIKELNDLLNDDSGSAKVRTQAETMLDKAQKAYANQKKASITRKENAKKSAEENKNRYASSSTYSSKYGNYFRNKTNTSTNDGTASSGNYGTSSQSSQSNNYGTSSQNRYGTQSNLSGNNSGYVNQSGRHTGTTQGSGSAGTGSGTVQSGNGY